MGRESKRPRVTERGCKKFKVCHVHVPDMHRNENIIHITNMNFKIIVITIMTKMGKKAVEMGKEVGNEGKENKKGSRLPRTCIYSLR